MSVLLTDDICSDDWYIKKVMISIVTVCYNEEKTLGLTMASVFSQTYTDYEYLIKDGGSTDDTINIAGAFKEKFEKRGIKCRIISEKDEGLYDAMNTAAKEAAGDYIIFMNSGDLFFDCDVLKKIFEGKDRSDSDLIYGDAVETEFGEYYYFRKCPELIEERMPFSHQTVFASKALLEEYPFDLNLKITADYDFLLRTKKAGRTFTDSNVVTALISKDGVSTVRLKDTYLESIEVRKKNGIEQPSDKEIKKALRFVSLKQFGMDHFPKWLKFCIRKVQRFLRHQKKLDVVETRRGFEIV